MKNGLRYTYRFICSILLTILATASFEAIWYMFVCENNQTGHLLGIGNLGMAAGVYAVIFFMFNKFLGSFKVGVERKSQISASVALAVFATNTVEVFVSMAITGQFRFGFQFLWRYMLLSLAQTVLFASMLILMTSVYRVIVPPIKLLEIVGKDEHELTRKMNGIRYKYFVENVLPYDIPYEELEAAIEKSEAVLINDIPTQEKNLLIKTCFKLNKRVYVVPKISDILLKSSDDLNLIDTPLFLCRNIGLRTWQRIVKRMLDLVLSIFALIVLSPLFLITAIAIKLEDHGPVFYRQERVTLNDKRFMILKFRSMIVEAEKDGKPRPAGEKDDRITKVGRIIRACRIDELPQLINIIKGDMSIVGPRPERWEHVEKYCAEIPEFSFRHKVKGGLTGYAQVYGKYNTTALDKLKLDLHYIANYSLIMDVQIIFETVKILFVKESTEGFSEEKIQEIREKL